jgi:hypothetical protein
MDDYLVRRFFHANRDVDLFRDALFLFPDPLDVNRALRDARAAARVERATVVIDDVDLFQCIHPDAVAEGI